MKPIKRIFHVSKDKDNEQIRLKVERIEYIDILKFEDNDKFKKWCKFILELKRKLSKGIIIQARYACLSVGKDRAYFGKDSYYLDSYQNIVMTRNGIHYVLFSFKSFRDIEKAIKKYTEE